VKRAVAAVAAGALGGALGLVWLLNRPPEAAGAPCPIVQVGQRSPECQAALERCAVFRVGLGIAVGAAAGYWGAGRI
jgi:hypothetical protein